MMYLVLWEANGALFPPDPEERRKLIMSMSQEVKESVDSGKTKMWGMSVGGGCGFSVHEGDEKEIYAIALGLFPHVKFEVKPMLSIDEVIGVMKEMQQ
jgi:hypothetical protein